MVVNRVRGLKPLGHNDKGFARACPLPDAEDMPLAKIKQRIGPRWLRPAARPAYIIIPDLTLLLQLALVLLVL